MKNAETEDRNADASTNTVALMLTIIILFGVLVRIGHWHPGFASDDRNYMNNAECLAHGQPPVVMNNHAVRLGYVTFLAVGMRIFGTTTQTCHALGLLVFVGTVVVLYIVASILYGRRPALTSVFLYSTLPLDVTNSTVVLPDGLMTMLALTATVLYLSVKAQPDGLRQSILAIFSGFVLGLAALVKEPAVFVGIAFALDLLVTRGFCRRILLLVVLMGVGGLLALGLEMLGFLLWTNDGLFRFHVSAAFYGSFHIPFSLWRAARYVLTASNTWRIFGVHGYLLFIGFVLAVNRGFREHSLPLLFCIVLATYLSIGSISLKEYVMVFYQPRYFHAVLVMGCAFVGMELYQAFRRLHIKQPLVVSCCIGLVLVSLWAAKMRPWRGTVQVADWLGGLEQVQKDNLVLLESFVRMQPLEYREKVNGFPVISDATVLSGENIAGELVGRGLVVDRYSWYKVSGKEALQDIEEHLVHNSHLSFRNEKLYGPSWPPYKRWLGLGKQQAMIGRIWWPESSASTER